MKQVPGLPLVLVRSPLIGIDLESELLLAGAKVQATAPAGLGLDLLRGAKSSGCRGVLTVNHSPTVALLCREAGLRYVSWTIDPLARDRWSLVEGCDATMFVHRRVLVEPLLRMGHRRVEWLPLAAPSRRREGPARAEAAGALFVGSSLQDERRLFVDNFRKWGIDAAVDPLLDWFAELSARAETDRSFHGFLRDPGLVPPSLLAATAGRCAREDLAEAMDGGLAWSYRCRQVRSLAGAGVEIRGDEGWREPCGDRWAGPLRNGQEMTAAYRKAGINLDVPRLHQREIATLRAFDVLACGGTLLVESGTELESLFRAGEEFLTWRTPAERDELVARGIRDPHAFDFIAKAAWSAAAGHLLDSRVARILAAFEA